MEPASHHCWILRKYLNCLKKKKSWSKAVRKPGVHPPLCLMLGQRTQAPGWLSESGSPSPSSPCDACFTSWEETLVKVRAFCRRLLGQPCTALSTACHWEAGIQGSPPDHSLTPPRGTGTQRGGQEERGAASSSWKPPAGHGRQPSAIINSHHCSRRPPHIHEPAAPWLPWNSFSKARRAEIAPPRASGRLSSAGPGQPEFQIILSREREAWGQGGGLTSQFQARISFPGATDF